MKPDPDDLILPSRVASRRFDRVEFLALILQSDTLSGEACRRVFALRGFNRVVQGDGAKAKTALRGRQGNEHGQNGFHGEFDKSVYMHLSGFWPV